MRKSKYKRLPMTIPDGITGDIRSESKTNVFIKKIKSGEYLYNFKNFDYINIGNTKSKSCHMCINKIPCRILEEKFCEGNNFVPYDEYLPTYSSLEDSSQMAAAMGYFYKSLAGWFSKLSKEEDRYYNAIEINKKDGGVRKIYEPNIKLKIIQYRILEKILYKYVKLPGYITGCVPGKSTSDNASPHVGKAVVIKMDIKNFFPSVYASMVYKTLKEIFPDHVSKMITRLCCYKGHTPQGAPTSPYLANMVAMNLDKDLIKLCRSRKWTYTRYVDDMTFSVSDGRKSVKRDTVDSFIKEIYSIVGKNFFRLNSKKTVVMRKGRRQKVTGIVVNEKINIPKYERNRLRAIIHNCKKHGIESQKGDLTEKEFINKISGYISYTRGVNKHLWRKINERWREARYNDVEKTAPKNK